MTYLEYLKQEFSPSNREDVGFIVSLVTAIVTSMLLLATVVSLAYHDFSGVVFMGSVIIGVAGFLTSIFFIGTFVYWMIVIRKAP
jgi:hypothetical protein